MIFPDNIKSFFIFSLTITELKIIHWNIRSSNSNKDNLISIVRKYQPDVICLNETWLRPNSIFNINSYNIVRQDRTDGYGGVAICIKNNVIFNQIKTYNDERVQYIVIQIKNINIINIYSNSHNSITEDLLTDLYNNLSEKSILLGDLNSHHPMWGNPKADKGGNILCDFILERDLIILNDETPTLFQNPNLQKSIIDLAIASNNVAPNLRFEVTPDCGNSDHFPILLTNKNKFSQYSSDFKTIPYYTRNFRKADWTLFYEKTLSEFSGKDGNQMNFTEYNNRIKKVADLTIPLKKVNNSNTTGNPWWDDECTTILKQRKQHIANFNEHPNIENYILAKKQIAMTKKVFREKKKLSFTKFCDNLNRNANIAQVWKKINKFNGQKQKNKKHNINDEMRKQVLKNVAITEIYPNIIHNTPTQDIEPFTMEEFNLGLKGKKMSTPGMDDVSYEMIKNLPATAKQILLNLYNSYLNGTPIPKDWKKYNIIPILKPNKDPHDINSYRPIILSSCYLKLIEIMIKNRIEKIIESRNIFTHHQTGFRKGISINHNIALIISHIKLAFEKNETILAAFIDLKSAYDCVSIQKLYQKMEQLSIPTQLSNLIYRILEHRNLYSRKNDGEFMDPITTMSGLPQGSPLSTILFNIYTHQLYEIIDKESIVIGYADDIVILSAGKETREISNKINSAINKMQEWLTDNNLNINTDKTDLVWFTKAERKNKPPPITLNGQVIPLKNQTKHLGVILHKHLNWRYHIDYIANKAKKNINILKAICRVWWGADPRILLTVFYATVRSHLDYGSIFLSQDNQTNANILNTVHYAGLRACLGCMRSTPTNVLLAEASEMSLEYRRRKLAINFLAKTISIIDHPIPNILKKLRIYHNHNAGAYRNRNTSYLLQAYEKFFPYGHKMYKSKVPPCFDRQFASSQTTIKKLNLNLKKQAPGVTKIEFIEATQKYKNSHTFIYTDASKQNNKVGMGIHIPDINYNFSSRLPTELCITMAEMVAINEATKIAISKKLKQAIIFSDSLSAITKITDTHTDTTTDYITISIRKAIKEAKIKDDTDIALAWIPGHEGIQGNEKADTLARIGSNLQVSMKMKIHIGDITNVIQNENQKDFWEWWKDSIKKKGTTYGKIQFSFPKKAWFNKHPYIDRRHITTIIRMRSGHCLVGEHLYKIGVRDDPNCECGMSENINHLLFECPISKIPNFDLYEELMNLDQKIPISCQTILADMNPDIINRIMKFLQYNRIKL